MKLSAWLLIAVVVGYLAIRRALKWNRRRQIRALLRGDR